jgi:hypothetical protein
MSVEGNRASRTVRAFAWSCAFLASCLGATGCATMRELPRAEYAARAERKGVAVDTREGLHYRFDHATFGPDTVFGYRLRDTEGAFEEYFTVAIPLERIERLSVRQTNWLRTGLIGGGVVVGAAAAVVAKRRGSTDTPSGPELPGGIDP